MSIEKNFEKEKIENLKKKLICKILFGRLLPLIEENKYQAWCSELVSEYQKSSLQHLTIVFTLNVIFEL